MGLGLWGIWLLAGRLSARIKALEHATLQFSAGKKDISLPLKGDDEIAATGRAFKSMMWQIREKYEAINLSPDGVLLVSSNQRINHTNKALVSILGERAEHLSGKPFAEFKRLLIDVLDRRRHPHIVSFEELIALPEITVDVPELKVLHCIRKRVDSPDGHSSSEVFYFRDVTQETEVDRMKSEFLNTAAHELRTPLASVMGFSELMMNNNYSEDTVKMLAETINRQSMNLKHLVDDLLDIARIEARGGDSVNLTLGTARSLVDECCETITVNDNSCDLHYEAAQCVWPQLMLDENKIKQALMNILTNAFKYSRENGLVVVDTIQLTDEFEVVWFGIRVTDQGIGMSQEQLARVGEKFYRADNAGSIPGTGLGVALTSEILALHDGHIEITSQLGQGTQVTLWIPVVEQSTKAADLENVC
jgi:signal transduction histidine kinase